MSLWTRTLLLLRVRTSATLDRAEDPRLTFEYAYGQRLELLRKVRQGLVEVATSKRQLEQQAEKLRSRVPRLEDQARRALAAGREDLTRSALQRKQTVIVELEGLDRQLTEVAEEERRLAIAERRLSAHIDELRTRRDVVSARYTAAEAQVRVHEALTGVSEELAELWQALQRAEDKTERMRARASAIDALVESDTLVLPGGGGDLVERELRDLTARQAVDEELAALKAQLGQSQSSPHPAAAPEAERSTE